MRCCINEASCSAICFSLPWVSKMMEFTATLQTYKAGKASPERRVVAAENWWKLRNRFEERKQGHGSPEGYQSESGWLHNVIVSKHADAMEAYPEPLILPREPGDQEEARLLSAILPCILEQEEAKRIISSTSSSTASSSRSSKGEFDISSISESSTTKTEWTPPSAEKHF